MARTAIVTGASSGIGLAVSRKLVASGHNVMMAARRTDRLEGAVSELGDSAAFHRTDVTSLDDVHALVDATNERFGQVDVLVNNAGIMPVSLTSSGRVDDWNNMIDVNMRGVLHGIEAVLPQMIEREDGHIVNVSSVAGHTTSPVSAVYSATKYGVRALSEGLRQEMTSKNVRVTIISPGAVETELGDSITDENIKAAMTARFDFDFLEADQIADAVAYAVEQPASVCVSEIIIRPTGQVV